MSAEEKKRRRLRPKYIIAAALLLFFSACYLFDFLWAKTYEIAVLSVSDETPVADNKERVEIRVRVTHFGKTMSGHKMFALPTAGTMTAYTAVTDSDGTAVFVYTPYTESIFTPANDVVIKIRDESNSVIWEVNAFVNITLRLQPKEA